MDNTERKAKYIKALGEGATPTAAVAASKSTHVWIKHWLATDDEFREGVAAAEADAEIVRVVRIEKAGKAGDWKADAWWLERRRKDYQAVQRMVLGQPEQMRVIGEVTARFLEGDQFDEWARMVHDALQTLVAGGGSVDGDDSGGVHTDPVKSGSEASA